MSTDALSPYQFGVCVTTGWTHKTIAWATGGEYTHAYISLPGETWSMEPGGLVKRELEHWGDDNPHSRYDLTTEQKMLLIKFISDHQGVKYDYVGDFIVGLDDVTIAAMDPFWHQIEHWEDKISPAWFCSAFVDAAFTYAGIKVIDDGRPAHGVTPMDLYRLVIQKNGWEEAA